MFGPDTPLVIDALQMAGLAALAGAGGVWLLMRRRKASDNASEPREKSELEQRVQVLERIATDRSHELSDEIEKLRDTPANREHA